MSESSHEGLSFLVCALGPPKKKQYLQSGDVWRRAEIGYSLGPAPRLVKNAKKRAFFSYSHSDKAFVRFVFDDLRALDLDIWIDELEMGPGDSLVDRIGAGLSESDFVVAFLSPASVESRWVRTELAIAATAGIRNNRVFVLPILMHSIEEDQVPPYLSHLIYVDLRAGRLYDESLQRLVGRLCPSALQLGEGQVRTPLWRKVLTMDDSRAERLVSASRAELAAWSMDYLLAAVARRDSSERHWVYTALGKIGGAVAKAAVERGLHDQDAFARLGAERAWKTLGENEKS